MRIVKCCLTLFLFMLLSITVLAHPGRTDENGGHYDNSTGEYHYHHGYPAHQHENGVCPYDFKDNTDHRDSESGTTSSKNKTKSKTVKKESFIKRHPALSLISGTFVLIFLIYLFGNLCEFIKKHKEIIALKIKYSVIFTSIYCSSFLLLYIINSIVAASFDKHLNIYEISNGETARLIAILLSLLLADEKITKKILKIESKSKNVLNNQTTTRMGSVKALIIILNYTLHVIIKTVIAMLTIGGLIDLIVIFYT